MTPTTKLEAVNIMLSSIGESPVNSLNSGLVDAEIAETILNGINREIQGKGWHFNTEIKMRLSPSLDNEVVLPPNTLRVDRALNNKDEDLIQRGGKLYNKSNHSFNITSAVEVDMVILLDFEDIPEAARRYITIRAARIFQDTHSNSLMRCKLGSNSKMKKHKQPTTAYSIIMMSPEYYIGASLHV
jgi:hypothetical protein